MNMISRTYKQYNFSIFFNLSHVHNKAIIAINNTEIGVDIEYVNNTLNIYELVDIIFSSQEYEEFSKLKNYNQKISYFYRIWTKKEAYLKVLSIGLVDNLKEIHIGVELKSKITNKFVIQNVKVKNKGYKANIAFKGNKYKNPIYFSYTCDRQTNI